MVSLLGLQRLRGITKRRNSLRTSIDFHVQVEQRIVGQSAVFVAVLRTVFQDRRWVVLTKHEQQW